MNRVLMSIFLVQFKKEIKCDRVTSTCTVTSKASGFESSSEKGIRASFMLKARPSLEKSCDQQINNNLVPQTDHDSRKTTTTDHKIAKTGQ